MTVRRVGKMTLAIAYSDAPPELRQLGVAGLLLGEHITTSLRTLRDLRVVPLDHMGPTTGTPRGREGLEEGTDLLIIDADAWFSAAGLERMLLLASEATGPLKVVISSNTDTDRLKRRKDTLALYLPPPAASAFVRKRGRKKMRQDVAQVSRSFRGTREVSANQLDSEQPARRIRTLIDVSKLEKDISQSRATAAMIRGVRMRDPGSVSVRGDLQCGQRVEIDRNVIIEGRVILEDDVVIGANSVLINATIGARSRVNAFSMVENAEIGADTFIGPFARVRPGCVIGDSVQIGNFVEIKNSEVGAHSRINHLTFVGDATLGKSVTLGAGTITCNHNRLGVARTQIGDGAYIGSGTELVAPVSVGEGATIGAGSTITHAVPPGQLTVARARQITVAGWKSPAQRSDEGG